MRTRVFLTVATLMASLAGLAGRASGATYLNQISGGSASGLFGSSFASASACMDDFEIFGTTGPGSVSITSVEAVFAGTLPSLIRVNIYHNTGDPGFTNLRTQPQGDVFSQVFDSSQFTLVPFLISGEAGTFPGGILLNVPISGLNLEFGAYYMSIQSMDTTDFAIFGSDLSTIGTPNDMVTVLNQGPGGIVAQLPTNAAYRINGIPTPGAMGVLGLGLLAATRRRR